MKKFFSIIFVLPAVVAIFGIIIMKYIHDNDPVNIPDSNIHKNHVVGEVVEITEDGIIIRVTKDLGEGYRVDDKVGLRYSAYHEIHTTDVGWEESAPEIGDGVSASFWEEQVHQEEDMDWIEVEEVNHYLNLEEIY